MNKDELELKLNKEEILKILKLIKEYGVDPFLLYATLLNLSEDKKVCSVSVDKLMQELNACKSQVYVYISKLKKIGLISTTKKDGEIFFYLSSINSIINKKQIENNINQNKINKAKKKEPQEETQKELQEKVQETKEEDKQEEIKEDTQEKIKSEEIKTNPSIINADNLIKESNCNKTKEENEEDYEDADDLLAFLDKIGFDF